MMRQSAARCLRLQAPRATIALRNGLGAAGFRTAASQSAIITAPLRAVRPVDFSKSSLAVFSRSMSAAADAAAEQSDASPSGNPTRFDQLRGKVHDNLIRAFVEDMGYETMTPVQSATIYPGLHGKDLVAQAKTGTGKTIGFLLPLLQRMLDEDPSLASRSAKYHARSDDIRGIVLSPTRELAEQIAEEARKIVRHTGLVVQSAVGGTDKRSMLRKTQREGCHLMVATPGRLNDLMEDRSSGIAAPNVAALVLDEADRMLDVGFMPQLKAIQSMLPARSVKERQTLLFSATIPKEVVGLARSLVRVDNFDFIQTISANDVATHEKVPQFMVTASSHANLYPAMWELIETLRASSQQELGLPFKAIVYFSFTAQVKLVQPWARAMGYGYRSDLPSSVIHSGLTQASRENAADFFRKAESGILFSSDVTARGMDFPNVTHVIQVGLPTDTEQYIHRIGRTGRQNKNGQGWLIVPHCDLRKAREVVGKLPLKLVNNVASAEYDAANPTTPEPDAFAKSKAAAARLPAELFNDAYVVQLAVGTMTDEKIKSINKWATDGMGMEQPPPVRRGWARKIGIPPHPSLNLVDSTGFDAGSRANSGSRDAWGSRESSDGFESRFGNAEGGERRSQFGGGNRFGGDRGSGGRFGGDRGSGGRFGGDRGSGGRSGGDRGSGGRFGGDRGSGGRFGDRDGGDRPRRSPSAPWEQRGSNRAWTK